jgi:hypothetical protein
LDERLARGERVAAVMLRAMSFSSSAAPFSSRPSLSDMPALLTSTVIAASLASRPSVFATSAWLVRSAGTTRLVARPREHRAWRKRHVVDIAVQGLVHSKDKLRHATKSPPQVLQNSLRQLYAE